MNSTATAANGSTRDGAIRNLVSISPFFIVKDLQASIAFYRERLDIHPHEHATFRHDLPPLYVALRGTLIGIA